VKVRIYDATLTEGTCSAGVQFSARDKLRIAVRLAELGVAWVEAGWPGRRPSDLEVFRAARGVPMGETRLAACAELRLRGRAGDAAALTAALRVGVPAVTLSISVWRRRMGPAAARAGAAIAGGVRRVRAAGREALVDLGDFFDAWREQPVLAMSAVQAAARSGAEVIILSDTLGGALPGEVEAVVAAARRAAASTAIGIRARNDAGLALASTLAAVGKGASVLVGTVNGYGERCGAADLVAVLPNLELKLGRKVLREGQLRSLTPLAHFVAELADQPPPRGQPFAGRDAFPESEDEGRAEPLHHVDPSAVGNRPEPAMSDACGNPRALRAARELGLAGRKGAGARRVVKRLAEWERQGFRYEGAEASFDLLLRSLAARRKTYFRLLGYRMLDVNRADAEDFIEASVDVLVGGEVVHAVAEGVGPVHALDQALRRALEGTYPSLVQMHFVDARSRQLTPVGGSAAAVRVLIESADERDRWGTAGVSVNTIDAWAQALSDAIEYKLVKDDVSPTKVRRR
jgi:2-isopropylmalate synthase